MNIRRIKPSTRVLLTALLTLAVILVQFGPGTSVARAAGYVVTNLDDSGAGSLRDAIEQANANPGLDTIDFDSALNGGTITLATQLTVTDDLIVQGPGADQLTISGGDVTRVIQNASNLTIAGLTIANGFSYYEGGGINSSGTLTVTDSTISGNTTNYEGGGIISSGTLTVTDSTISGNSANAGGGIATYGTVTTVTNSTLSGNTADSDGGGIFNRGTMTVTNSTISGNSVGDPIFSSSRGGGIFNGGTMTVTNSTISGNSASIGVNSRGGGIFNGGTVTVTNSLFTANTAPHSANCAGGPDADSSNIVEDNDGCGGSSGAVQKTAAEINLGPLADNGGPTLTHALLPGSVAIDFLAPDGSGNCSLATDQRGVTRPQGGGCDVGAYEVVQNQAPTADPNGPYLGAVNESIAFDGGGSYDPDGDPLSYAWEFGDDSSGSGVMPDHSYVEAGIYNVCLTVDDGTVGSPEVCTMAVVYDPSGGFVTGGGWIDSPAGAYTADSLLTGKATFGFVSKYKKGASVPTGNTEFQFDTGGFNFHSEAYDWLVVNKGGANAQFKGSGTVNDGLDSNGNPYKFMLWAGDGSPDTFRIKIWWEDNGVESVVYDNGTDQAIGAGSIVVHSK